MNAEAVSPTEGRGSSFRAVERTIRVLTALGKQAAPASVSDVAEATGLNRAATHRVLRALEATGSISRANNGYHLGPLMFELGRRVFLDKIIDNAARQPLEALTKRFGEATHASILSREEVLLVVYSPSYRSLSLGRRAGVKMPPYQGSSGKVLLAAAPAADLHKYLASAKLLPATRNTITSPARLLRELEKVRQQGYAINRAEHFDGQKSVSVPVLGFDGEWLAAIAMSAPAERMPETFIPDVLAALRETSRTISHNLFQQTTEPAGLD